MCALPYGHQDLDPKTEALAKEALVKDGRVERAHKEAKKRKRIVVQDLPSKAAHVEDQKWYCYIHQDVVDQKNFYVGQTNNLAHRLEQHLGNIKGGAVATAGKSWICYAYATMNTKKESLEAEAKIKKRQKQRLGLKLCTTSLKNMCERNNWTFTLA